MTQFKTVTVPFNQLHLSSANVRKKRDAGKLAALAASIRTLGLLQNLVVHADKQGHAVVAGGNRYLAIKQLVDGGELPIDWPTSVCLIDANDSTAVSLAENVQREAMHPADEFHAFLKLSDGEGWTIDRIADAFSVTPLVVERRLRLAAAAPELIEAFREDELTTDQLIALCATDDHERQVDVWNRSKDYVWMCKPKALRKAVLADDEIDVSRDPRIDFIGGLDVYRDAGGEVRRDLFTGEGNGGFITDGALLDKLVADKLDETAAQVRAEGWGWVELWPEFDWEQYRRFGRAPKLEESLPEEVRIKIESLDAEGEKLANERDAIDANAGEYSTEDSERLYAIDERMSAIEEEIEELKDAHAIFAPEVMANSGAVVTLDDDRLRIERGLVKSADRNAVAAAIGAPDAVTGGRVTEPAGRKPDALSEAVRSSLLGHRNLAAQVTTADQPTVAKVLLACWTVQHIRMDDHSTPSDFSITGKTGGTRIYHKIADETGKAKEEAFADVCQKAVVKLPKADDKLWDALSAKSAEELDRIIAYGVALSVSLSTDNNGLTGKLLASLGFDMAAHFTATAENYLGKVSKSMIVEALREAGKITNAAHAERIITMKKGELADYAEGQLAGTGWVPSVIRSPKAKKQAVAQQQQKKSNKSKAAKVPARVKPKTAKAGVQVTD